MPKYLALAEDVSPSVDKNDWWRKHETELPHWSKACKMVLLVQSSPAAAERFFSSFKQFYGAANVVIGGLHRKFYNASVQQTEQTIFLMFDFYWNNCRIIWDNRCI